jgi:hypothetical protein
MRVYDCAKKELQKISELNYKHYDDEKYNKFLDLDIQASMEKDFNPKDFDIKMVADPSQGSDIERVQRAQVVYDMATDPSRPNPALDPRKATEDLLEVMSTQNIEELMPLPDPNARNPADEMQQAMIAGQMADIELRKQDQDLRAQDLQLKQLKQQLEQQKAALEGAKTMSELGLKADEQEAKITLMYAQTLEKMANFGMSAESAMSFTKNIENTFG